jgi:hypothetical protein
MEIKYHGDARIGNDYKGVHVGDDKDFLFMHKNHMTPQIPSCISKVVATNNFERLIPWSWLIQNGLQLEYHTWNQTGPLGVHHNITNHLETQTCCDY